MGETVRRDGISGPALAWLLFDVTNVLAEIGWRLPFLWPPTYRVMSRLDAELVRRRVWTVDDA